MFWRFRPTAYCRNKPDWHIEFAAKAGYPISARYSFFQSVSATNSSKISCNL